MVPPRIGRVGSRTGGVLLSVLFWGTIAAVILLLVVPPFLRRSSEPTAAAGEPGQTTEAADPNKIHPDAYQDHIRALEQRLYRDAPGGFDDADYISHLVMTLSVAVRGDGRNRRRLNAFGKLFDYAGEVSSQAGVGYTTANLEDLRTRWEQTRDAVFLDASWFSRSTEALAAAQAPAAPTVNPAVVRQLTDFANELEGMIRTGKRAAMAIPEAGVDAALHTREARVAEEQWRSWSNRWVTQLQSAVRYGPPSLGLNPDINITLAYQELQQVMRELRLVPTTAASTTTVPFKYEREMHFTAAIHFLQSAREYLAKLDR